MPAETERREELVRAHQQLVVPSRIAECAESERLVGGSCLNQLWRLELDAVPHAERDEGIEPGREDSRTPDQRALDRKIDERPDGRKVPADEPDPNPGRAQGRVR